MTAASKRQRLLRIATKDAQKLLEIAPSHRWFKEQFPGFDALVRHADWTNTQGKERSNGTGDVPQSGSFVWFGAPDTWPPPPDSD
jgi:hypothetical protein